MEKAVENRTRINQIKSQLDYGLISYAEAEEMARPIINAINEKSRELAKKYGMRPQLVDFRSLMR